MKNKETATRAVGYCRTSGEGQRDNTSIPDQKKDIEAFCANHGYQFLRHYTDESRSGAKIAGRDSFQELMRDAAAGKFDTVVVYQVDRFGRDGVDILHSCKTLRDDFQINVTDTTGRFDTQRREDVFTQYIDAARAEDERLRILRRTMRGRMANARVGKPWAGASPVGRKYDEKSGWYITEQGCMIKKMLTRYASGESLGKIAKELGIKNRRKIFSWIHDGGLAGPYRVRFQSPDIGLDETIEVPGIPEVVPPALLEKVKARSAQNKTFNRNDAKQYPLSGFIFCEKCGRALSAQTTKAKNGPREYYRHKDCSVGWSGIRGEKLTESVLDCLYRFCVDEPAFDAAVRAAMPDKKAREAKVREHDATAKALTQAEKRIAKLVDAIADGADVGLLLEKQDELKTERERLRKRLDEQDRELASMPSAEEMKFTASLYRLSLAAEHSAKNWRSLPVDEIKRFLHFIFGPSPAKEGTGLYISKDDDGAIIVSFRGRIEIPFEVNVKGSRGVAVSQALKKEAARCSRSLKSKFQYDLDRINREYRERKRALLTNKGQLKLVPPNLLRTILYSEFGA